nr:aldolase/citrate lyase family protein [Nocardia neocaledoniensis]
MNAHLPAHIHARVDAVLDAVDTELRARYPGAGERVQPVHTAYVAADRATAATPADWGATALDLLDRHAEFLAGLDATGCAPAVRRRLTEQPIQDLRIDFEDGYGFRADDEEDAAAIAAGKVLAGWAGQPGAPSSFGIRIKGLAANERRRALRTLDLVLDAAGGAPDGFVFTVPKIRAAQQVSAIVDLCSGLESGYGLPDRTLRFELQIESPQAIIAPDGTAPIARMIQLADGRCSALHFGTYDYTAACGIAATDQALDHPAADHAKAVMQVAAAQTGVWICDGSTQIVPDTNPEGAFANHYRLVERALRRGYYQGWDMHPGHLITRWLATYDFFRTATEVAVPRLVAYLDRRSGGVVDEPATAEALATTVLRGLRCGAVTEGELASSALELDVPVLEALAARKPTPPDAR